MGYIQCLYWIVGIISDVLTIIYTCALLKKLKKKDSSESFPAPDESVGNDQGHS